MRTRILVFIFLLVASAALAQPSLKDLDPFIGTWNCTGTGFASEMGPEHPTTATVTGKWMLGKKWLSMRYTEVKTAKNPHPIDVIGYWGYDEGSKKLVALSADNFGGYGTGESDGWSADELVFAGPSHMGPMSAQGRDHFGRKGKNEVTHSFEMQSPNGGWTKMDQETCKRQSGG
jgi:uncharacterized protein DUF1579